MNAFIVAEIGAAHNGSLERALALIDAAAKAGANAVKLQTWSEMALPGHRITQGPWAGRDLAELYAEARTPWEWHAEIFERTRGLGMMAFSTPFDTASVDFLQSLGCNTMKIASAEITDLPLIRYAAAHCGWLIISTGTATEEEIADALDAALVGGLQRGHVTLLKCTAAYPAPIEDMNLRTLRDMRERWQCDVGLSDHTRGSTAAVVANIVGASMIEKHIGLDREGPDGGFCSLPEEFVQMVRDVRDAERALGKVHYGPLPSEAGTLTLRRSLWVIRDVKAGESVSHDNVRSLRPASGMSPGMLDGLIGERFKHDVAAGSAFVQGMI